MKNSNPSSLYTSKNLFHTIGELMRNGTRHKNADNYASTKTQVEAQIDAYDAAVAKQPIKLEAISPLWMAKCDESRTAHDMYDSQPKLIQRIRNDLMRINGGGGIYRCPLCEVNEVYHLDHYIPREKMPEFSVHPLNLIYICHDCNKNKGTKWLDGAGERVFFNAYFDRLSGKEVLECVVNDIVDGLPWAEVKKNTLTQFDTASMRELTTIKELEIDKRYGRIVNDRMQTQIQIALNQVKILKSEGKSMDEVWDFLTKSYHNALKGQIGIVERLLLKGMCNSSVLKDWLDSNS